MKAINFTISQSKESITFLDLELYKGHRFHNNGILDLKLYKKPTNPQTFLHYDSCHGRSTFPTIVRGEILRALRATSDAENYSIIVAKVLERFMQRGYPKHMLLQVVDTISYGDRAEHLKPHPKRTLQPNVTIFPLRHHPAIDSKAIWEILNDVSTPFLPMVTRPRPTSTRDALVRAKTRKI